MSVLVERKSQLAPYSSVDAVVPVISVGVNTDGMIPVEEQESDGRLSSSSMTQSMRSSNDGPRPVCSASYYYVPAKIAAMWRNMRIVNRELVPINPDDADYRPTMRGVIHLIATPLAMVAGLILVALGSTLAVRIACAIFTLGAVLTFGCSALFHLGNWSSHMYDILQRLDHANIFVLIAGTYTPLVMCMLDNHDATVLLIIVWVGAIVAMVTHVIWIHAPRWLYTVIYIVLGWVAVFYVPKMWTRSPIIVMMVAGGGVAYTVGAVSYGMMKPNPSPRHFGYHEMFHVYTVIGYALHYASVCMALYL